MRWSAPDAAAQDFDGTGLSAVNVNLDTTGYGGGTSKVALRGGWNDIVFGVDGPNVTVAIFNAPTVTVSRSFHFDSIAHYTH